MFLFGNGFRQGVPLKRDAGSVGFCQYRLGAWDRLMHPQALEALSLGVLFSVTAVLVDLTVTGCYCGRRSGSLSWRQTASI